MGEAGNRRLSTAEPVLFAAIFPSPAALASISALQAELRQLLTGKISWVHPERMHVTVFFLGPERGRGLDFHDRIVTWALNEVGAGAFDLELSGLGMMRQRFGDGHRSIFLSGERCKPLVDLAARINRASNRPPHLTPARFRHRMDLPGCDFPPLVFRAERIALVRSVRDGPDFGYRVLHEWELARSRTPPPGRSPVTGSR